MLVALAAVAVLLAGLTLLPLSRHGAGWVRGLDFPKLQLPVPLLALLVLDAALLDGARASTWMLSGIAGLCLAHQLWWIVPYTRLFPTEVRAAVRPGPERTFSILVAKVAEEGAKHRAGTPAARRPALLQSGTDSCRNPRTEEYFSPARAVPSANGSAAC